MRVSDAPTGRRYIWSAVMRVSDAPSGTVTSGILSSRDTRTSLYIAGTDEGEAGRR